MIESSSQWLQLIPAEWIVTQFSDLLEHLPVHESIKDTIYRSKKLAKIEVTENFDSSLSGFQLLNYLTSEFAKNVEGIIFEPCSFKLYCHNNSAVEQFRNFELSTPSLFPFLTILTSKKDGVYRLTSHGLARFELPEFVLETKSQVLSNAGGYLLNAMAQCLIEKTIEIRKNDLQGLQLEKPLIISTETVVKGNQRNLPFKACVPRTVEVALKMREENGAPKLVIDFEGNNTDEQLENVLSKLSLIEIASTA